MNNSRLLVAVGWVGSIFGIIGSLLLAMHVSYSGYGFLAYLGSNVAWSYHGFKTRNWAMVVMQAGFTSTSLLGVSNWMF